MDNKQTKIVKILTITFGASWTIFAFSFENIPIIIDKININREERFFYAIFAAIFFSLCVAIFYFFTYIRKFFTWISKFLTQIKDNQLEPLPDINHQIPLSSKYRILFPYNAEIFDMAYELDKNIFGSETSDKGILKIGI
jgi:hypothetical protein